MRKSTLEQSPSSDKRPDKATGQQRGMPLTCKRLPVSNAGMPPRGSGFFPRFSGDIPLRVGETCPLTINLPDQHPLFVVTVTVRSVRGQEYGVETVMVEKQT